MQRSWAIKTFIVLAVLIIVVGMIVKFFNRGPEQTNNAQTKASPGSETTPQTGPERRHPSASPTAEMATEPDGEPDQAFALKLPRDKIEEYLTRRNRSAASLLAAFHASGTAKNPEGDINYLREAATNYPNDPHVQWAVLSHDVFPEERRKWLDAFKASSPDNSLGNYLSAQDYFKNKQPVAAIKELLEASNKPLFADFAMESYLGAEEIFREMGKTPLEANTAAMSAMSSDLLPELSNMKGIAIGVVEAQKQYAHAGDPASVQNLSQMGLQLASRLTDGDGGRFVISRLVGSATEAIVLKPLDQNTAYDFLGGKTPAQRLEELKQQKLETRARTESFTSAFSRLSEQEMVSYVERVKVYGEVAAMRWLQQQNAARAPQGGR